MVQVYESTAAARVLTKGGAVVKKKGPNSAQFLGLEVGCPRTVERSNDRTVERSNDRKVRKTLRYFEPLATFRPLTQVAAVCGAHAENTKQT